VIVGVASVRINFLSNLVGSIATAAILLAVLPIYLHYLGADAFGLIGVYTMLVGVAGLLDMGLTPALSRELALQSASMQGRIQIRCTVRTLEICYASTAVIIFGFAFILVPTLAQGWLKPTNLSAATVQQCLQIMSLQLAFQLPLSFYTGGFVGMQRQGLMNILNTAMTAVRAGSTVLLLYTFNPDVVIFFIWQVIVTAAHLLLMALCLWKILPAGGAVFKLEILKRLWRYAAGMIGITALSILLTQLDKIILSRTLSLEHFGYYMLAWNIASVLLRPIGPVHNAWLPKMTQLAMADNVHELAKLYHKGAQLVNLLVVPVAIFVAVFSHQVLYLYTGSRQLADATATALVLLTIGSACNALMNIPYALTLAYGWTKFAIYQNILASIVVLPLTYWASTQYGLNGGGVGWMVVNVLYIAISLNFIHRRYLKMELKQWYVGNFTLYFRENYSYIKTLFKHVPTR
jgi:O-antigen/teichoic acid export membrane protein